MEKQIKLDDASHESLLPSTVKFKQEKSKGYNRRRGFFPRK